MKILLTAINAKYIHSNPAVYSLKAYAKKYLKAESQVEIVLGEYTINQPLDEILEGIYREKPDVLCFSCYIWNIRYVTELIEEYHKIAPDIPIWVGGPEVSYEAEQFLREHPAAAGVMCGEGEETFLELCDAYAKEDMVYKKQNYDAGCDTGVSKSLEHIAGIAYQSSAGIKKNPDRQPIDMSTIPFCYDNITDFANRIIYYESSRGCPFSCSYCLSSVEKKLRFRDLSLVRKELAFFMEQKVPQVKFVDRTFNCHHGHAMEIWRYLKEHDNGTTNFHFEISADLLNEEELALLKEMRPGLVQLEIGVQSTNDSTIAEIHRSMDLARLKETVMQIQQAENIHAHLDLIAGLPKEDFLTFTKSFDEIYALKPNQLQLGFLKILKGSYMYEHAAEYAMIYHTNPPYEVFATKWIHYDEILILKQVEEMLEVYYNSGQYEVTMKLLETQFEQPFLMYQQLGVFYERKNYFSMSHARLRRAEILLEFAQETVPSIAEIIKESLVYDLYSRENMKSRPTWAADASEWKALTRRYCKNGKQSHVERFSYRFPKRNERSVQELPKRECMPVYMLFDYTNRDAFNHQAAVQYIDEVKNA